MITFKNFGLTFRTVVESDAGFILNLRNDSELSKHLSFVPSSLKLQIDWIDQYKKKEAVGAEFYFITEDSNGNPLGLNRLYNFEGESFEIGSWIFNKNLEISIPILSDLAIRDYGFEVLKFKSCHFNVDKKNKSVLKYHKMFNPNLVNETENAYFFTLDYASYKITRDKLLNTFL